jgi:hypothetical protein
MSRIYHAKFTQSGRLLRERAVGGRASHSVASTPISNPKETLLVGTLKGVFEEAQPKHRVRNKRPVRSFGDHRSLSDYASC